MYIPEVLLSNVGDIVSFMSQAFALMLELKAPDDAKGSSTVSVYIHCSYTEFM